MGRNKEFNILFDNDKATYFAGEQLAGTVLLEFSEPTNVVRLMLTVKGKAVCKVGNSCTELVYKNDATLYGSLVGSSSTRQHPAGKQNYRFNFNLPAELPSSTIESGGMIKYTLTAKVVFKGLLSSDWQVKKDFKVRQILDANIPNFELQNIQTVKKTPTLFTNQKKLEREDLLVNLQRGVYCCGEGIKVNIQYKYAEARKMGIVKCRLNKYKQLNKRENKSVYKKTVKEQNDSKRNDDKIFQRMITVPIPTELSPTNTLTNAVVLNYVLHVKVEGYKEVKLPLILGTIPFDENRSQNVDEYLRTVGAGTLTDQPMSAILPSVPSAPSAPPSAPDNETQQPSESRSTSPSEITVTGGEIQCDFFHPPPYVPDNEFESPPSYDEVLQETIHQTNSNPAGQWSSSSSGISIVVGQD